MKNKRNRWVLLLLLLLLCFAAIWYFFLRTPTISREGFVQQGITTVKGSPEISIWDYSAVDGDTVDFYFDGKLIFKSLGLGDTAVTYKTVSLSKGEHWIGIKAINEGFNPPATPHISITDDKEKFEFDIDSWKDSASGSWLINVE
ncbi:hypothetical protein [Ferruginibacter sp. HRS2-29]|uniref:hypothetical protein n=1 Tax=Ferruginibacter sp. HRS2-29 TaxID=2487334 RepID=UPI0020CFBCD0|nr:hypothetical protein [Ferruginibacter sp. HRS2-29]MCP9752771.1 hypothetical protein [Ferruginibacter sp. HRS2-29]